MVRYEVKKKPNKTNKNPQIKTTNKKPIFVLKSDTTKCNSNRNVFFIFMYIFHMLKQVFPFQVVFWIRLT